MVDFYWKLKRNKMFKAYESKPLTRMACEILYPPSRYLNKESTWRYNGVEFKAYEEPKVGDFIVRLTDEDTYHCSKAVFHERNIVP